MIEAFDPYMATLSPPTVSAARHLVTQALEAGMTVDSVIDGLLAPAQREVGRRWQTNQWSIAQEHAATAVTDSALAAASLRAGMTVGTGRLVVTGCVEGEWHTMPVRMLNECLAAAGFEVVFLGPSLPASQVTQFVDEIRPHAVLLGCTMPTNMAGARRTIEAAHEAGVPVIIGGRAIDVGGVRARALGAEAHAHDAAAAERILRGWEDRPPPIASPIALIDEQLQLEVPSPDLIDECVRRLVERQPAVSAMSATHLTRTRDDITYILQFCSAAMVSGDATVFAEFTAWLRDVLAHRGVPDSAVPASYRAIAEALGGGHPRAVELLENALSPV